MTVNLTSVHPSTVLIPAPRFKLGELVSWTDDGGTPHQMMGVVIEQVHRSDYEGGSWQFTIAITYATYANQKLDYYMGHLAYDVEDSLLMHADVLTDI